MNTSPPMLLDGMSLKIRSFLANAGFPVDPNVHAPAELIRYFESEYDMDVLGFLEKEWVDEQIERDVLTGPFKDIRESVAEEPGREDEI